MEFLFSFLVILAGVLIGTYVGFLYGRQKQKEEDRHIVQELDKIKFKEAVKKNMKKYKGVLDKLAKQSRSQDVK